MTNTIQILLVEDNPADADLMKETMETSKLHLNIDVVYDGEAAMQYLNHSGAYASAHRPDLILLDLNLPKVNGKQVLGMVKSSPELKGIPVVMLTSSAAERDITQSYDLGVNCYVVKPVDLKAFQEIVSAVENFWFTVVKLPHEAREKARLG